jgi:hypothetical protein
VAEARVEYVYSARGQKLSVKQRWNPNYSTSPVIGSAVNASSLTSSTTLDYVGRYIYLRPVFTNELINPLVADHGDAFLSRLADDLSRRPLLLRQLTDESR